MFSLSEKQQAFQQHSSRFPCCVFCICLSTEKTNTKQHTHTHSNQMQKHFQVFEVERAAKVCQEYISIHPSKPYWIQLLEITLSFLLHHWIQSNTVIRNIHSSSHFFQLIQYSVLDVPGYTGTYQDIPGYTGIYRDIPEQFLRSPGTPSGSKVCSSPSRSCNNRSSTWWWWLW